MIRELSGLLEIDVEASRFKVGFRLLGTARDLKRLPRFLSDLQPD